MERIRKESQTSKYRSTIKVTQQNELELAKGEIKYWKTLCGKLKREKTALFEEVALHLSKITSMDKVKNNLHLQELKKQQQINYNLQKEIEFLKHKFAENHNNDNTSLLYSIYTGNPQNNGIDNPEVCNEGQVQKEIVIDSASISEVKAQDDQITLRRYPGDPCSESMIDELENVEKHLPSPSHVSPNNHSRNASINHIPAASNILKLRERN